MQSLFCKTQKYAYKIELCREYISFSDTHKKGRGLAIVQTKDALCVRVRVVKPRKGNSPPDKEKQTTHNANPCAGKAR